MPHHLSCKKRMRTSKEENLQNRSGKSQIKTATKKVLLAKTKAEAEPLVREAISVLDKMAQKGIIHKNNAANKKSTLMNFFNRLPA
ncbi:MAG: 30S ribosomal protein S20 [bacterium]|nr:30S ribosomal protein S20 [bacterium]